MLLPYLLCVDIQLYHTKLSVIFASKTEICLLVFS